MVIDLSLPLFYLIKIFPKLKIKKITSNMAKKLSKVAFLSPENLEIYNRGELDIKIQIFLCIYYI